jgi:hypothetical protein
MRRGFFVAALAVLLASGLAAQASVVKTVHDEKGWKLTVDDVDLPVMGAVWSFTPVGENYTYDLFAQPEDVITKTIDTDMTLMKSMGVTAIRCFSTIPAPWVEYIYDRFGIYTMVNDLFGRYGVSVDGRWYAKTDYSDPDTRKMLLAQAKKTFETYKDTRGVLLFMLGNESNYGLEWSSNTIENLPGGERDAFKAKALYSLFEEAIKLGKSIDPNHPIGLCNGDLQYLQTMKDLVPDLDFLGVNTYRGPQSFDGFYQAIAKDLGKPFVYTEIGADAYNVATEQEDQDNQALLIKSQWKEIYSQAYGKGKSANCLGGFVFEWMDEWWKAGMDSGLTVHDTAGTWSNGGYTFDAVPGRNNMNEEWFGILGLSTDTKDGIPRRLPRSAYFLLKDLWRLDLYTSTKQDIAKTFDGVNLDAASRQGNLLALRDASTDPHPPYELHGSVTARSYAKGDNVGWAASGLSGLTGAGQVVTTFGAKVRAGEGLTGSFLFRQLPSSVPNDPAKDLSDPVESGALLSGSSTTVVHPIALYQATVDYQSPELTATIHYHDGHADWVTEGDLFGLLPEAWDLFHMDKGGSQAPFGIEVTLPAAVPGLKVYAGPELYWGANPAVMAKYTRTFGTWGFTVIHQQELGPYANLGGGTPPATDAQLHADRWSSAELLVGDPSLAQVEAGALLGRYNRVGDSQFTYTSVSGNAITTGSTFQWADALAAKVKFASDAVPYLHLQAQYLYAGLLADTRSAAARNGSQLFDSGKGNRSEVKVNAVGTYGDFSLSATGLYRVPLVDALYQSNLGVSPRDPVKDAFSVSDNRKAVQGEAVFTWNPTGATYFYDWNNADREYAPLAVGAGLLYNFDLGPTDALAYDAGDGVHTYVQTKGLPEVQGTYNLQLRVAGRPFPGVRINLTGQVANEQATGVDANGAAAVVRYWKTAGQVAWGRVYLEGSYATDAWGPLDWMRQFGITYPTQWMVGAAYGLKPLSFLTDTDRVGLRLSQRTYGAATPATEKTSAGKTLDNRFVAELYAGWSF